MHIQAIFSNGSAISRKTSRNLTHAYLAINQWNTFTGFASSEKLAKKAANYGNLSYIEIVKVTQL